LASSPRLRPPVQVALLQYTREGPRLVAAAARITVSKKPLSSAWNMSGKDVEKWIRELIRRGHGSPLEHSVYTFEAECSRVCSHQLVRHRLASYTQQSMRHTEGFLRAAVLRVCSLLGRRCPQRPGGAGGHRAYADALRAALDEAERGRVGWAELAAAASEAFVFNPGWSGDVLARYARAYLAAAAEYYEALSKHIPKEDARMLLPQAVRTRIVFTMNARELLESFLPLRMCSHAQWEIRMLAWKVQALLEQVHPEIFSYAGPRCVLQENRLRDEPCRLRDYLAGRCGFTQPRCPELVPRQGIPSCLAYAAASSGAIAEPAGSRPADTRGVHAEPRGQARA